MLECYFDDSSDERSERYRVSGGLIGNPDQWDAFTIIWSPEAKKLQRPFRSTECECGYGQFKDWPKQKRIQLMAFLVNAVRTTRLAGFASIVPVAAYKDAFPNCDKNDPYLLTIPHTVMNMAFLADKMKKDVSLWFERGKWNAAINESFQSVKNMDWLPARRLNGIALDSKELYPLQSADLIAREAFKHLDNRSVRPTRKPVKIMEGMICFIVWTEKALQYLAKNGGPKNLDLLASWDEHKHAPLEVFWRKF